MKKKLLIIAILSVFIIVFLAYYVYCNYFYIPQDVKARTMNCREFYYDISKYLLKDADSYDIGRVLYVFSIEKMRLNCIIDNDIKEVACTKSEINELLEIYFSYNLEDAELERIFVFDDEVLFGNMKGTEAILYSTQKRRVRQSSDYGLRSNEYKKIRIIKNLYYLRSDEF